MVIFIVLKEFNWKKVFFLLVEIKIVVMVVVLCRDLFYFQFFVFVKVNIIFFYFSCLGIILSYGQENIIFVCFNFNNWGCGDL